jgi:hypothetical protein
MKFLINVLFLAVSVVVLVSSCTSHRGEAKSTHESRGNKHNWIYHGGKH